MPRKYRPASGDSYRKVTGENKMSRMIQEDHNAVANLPQEVHYKPWPKQPVGVGYYLDDTIDGIDDTLHDTMRRVNEHQSDSMY